MSARHMPSVGFALAVAAVVAIAPHSSIAEPFNYQKHWNPQNFEIACGGREGPFRPDLRDTACISERVRLSYEVSSFLVIDEYRRTGFWAPSSFGPVIDGFDPVIDGVTEPYQSIRIFTDDTYPRAVAYVTGAPSEMSSGAFSHWCAHDANQMMFVNPANLTEAESDDWVTYVAAHELFHVIQSSLPENAKINKYRWGECYRPKWINEAHADATAIGYLRGMRPNLFPPRPDRYGPRYAGLRPYNVPLNYDFPESMGKGKHEIFLPAYAYRTSSLWRHIADRYMDGRFNYLEDFSLKPAPTYADGKEDWLRWLDERLQEHPKVKLPLYLFYPGFLTDFASEWAPGGIGENFWMHKWMQQAFGGCIEVDVSPDEPYIEIDVDLQKMAGRCLWVTIDGLAATDLAAVKIGALTERQDIADALHLGLSLTTDETDFNCSEHGRETPRPPGVARCLFEPVTGTLGTPVAESSSWQNLKAARMWHGSTIASGTPKECFEQSSGSSAGCGGDLGPQSSGGGGPLWYFYTIAYVPPEPWEEKLEGKPPINVKIGIGLEWSHLEVDGKSVNQDPAGSGRKSKRKRSAAAMGVQRLETDIYVPPSTGYIDPGPQEKLLGPIMGGIVADALDTLSQGNQGWDLVVGTAFGGFRLGEMEVTAAAEVGDTLKTVRVFSVRATQGEIPVGTTGTFDASMIGQIEDQPDVIYLTLDGDPARITVIENSRSVFRATVRGRICKYQRTSSPAAAMAAARATAACTEPLEIEGEIIKPFAYLYRQASALSSVETEGETLYNENATFDTSLASLMGGDGSGGADGAGGAAGGAAGPVCDCSCGARPEPQDTAGACAVQCLPAWAACAAAKAPEPPEPEKVAAPKPPTPTIEAQRKWFSRLIGRQDLPAEVAEMLVDDFVTMSDETRAYLIRRYRDPVQ